jgi:hypothetical protein
MANSSGRRRHWGRLLLLPTLGALALVAGLALASLTVSPITLRANGSYQGDLSLNYWTEGTVASSVIPATPPTAASTAVATPTTLSPAGTNYGLDPTTAGHAAVLFMFTEQTNATASTEIEITFTVGTQTGSTVVVKVYVKTQTSIPVTAQTFNFYYDLGTAAATPVLVVATADQTSQQCASVGSCP